MREAYVISLFSHQSSAILAIRTTPSTTIPAAAFRRSTPSQTTTTIKDVDSITLEDAIESLKYPVVLGNHPDDGQPVVLKLAKFGFFIGHQQTSVRIPKVIWQPYKDGLIELLPPFCSAGRNIWRAMVPLINFNIIEMHQPERVMRQFGYRQLPPELSRALVCHMGYPMPLTVPIFDPRSTRYANLETPS